MEDSTFPIPNLPNELIVEILTWLPVKPLLKFKSVCKSWRALISSQRFAKAHLKTLKSDRNLTYSVLIVERAGNFKKCSVHSLLYDSVSEASDLSLQFQPKKFPWPVSSCNGLVLLYMDEKELLLWNPSTRTCKKLMINGTCFSPYSLGYDKSNDDYKVVLFSRSVIDESEVMVQVYSVRNGRLKTVRNLDGRRLRSVGKFANGKLYWIAYPDCETGWCIVSLDMEKEEEEYEQLQMPNYVKIGYDSLVQVCEGSLYLICPHKPFTDVWILDGCGMGIEKWTKVVRVPCIDRYPWPHTPILLLNVGKNGLFLFSYHLRFVVYDAKDLSFRYPKVRNLGDCAVETYVESLVSPLG